MMTTISPDRRRALPHLARAQRQANPIFARYCNTTIPLQN
jgi:hypothetical protein